MRRGRTKRRLAEQASAIHKNEDRGLHYGPTPPYDPLKKAQALQIIESAFETMREAGVEFEPDPKVMNIFRDAGCQVSESGLVKFPTSVVLDALDSMAKSVKLWNRPGTEFIEVDNRHTWFVPGMTCIKVYDEASGEPRESTRDDLALNTRVADALMNMDAVCVTCKIVDQSDIHGEIEEFVVLAENTTKPLEYLCENAESLEVVIDMAAAIRGGHRQLAEKPYFMHLVTPLPMYYAKCHTDQIINGVHAGIPIVLGTIVIGGASAPITMAGCLVHCLATDFAGIVLGQLVRRGSFCIGASDPSFMEAATGGIGGFVQSSLADMVMCQVSRELDFPSMTGIGGCSLSRRFNQDAVWEISSTMMQTFFSRPATCDYVGSLDEGITYSLHAMLFCDDLIKMLRCMWKGISVDDDMLAMDLTLQEGPRGNYLANQHTVDHCRTEGWNSRFFGASMPLSNNEKPDVDLFVRIDEELKIIIETHKPEPLAPDILENIRSLQQAFMASYEPAA